MASAEVTEDRAQRKKLQNRINQRARRLRMREQGSVVKTCCHRPYTIQRWRPICQETVAANTGGLTPTFITASHDSRPSSTQSARSNDCSPVNARDHDKTHCDGQVVTARQPFPQNLSPAQDHLLTLIHFNVLRGLFSNKSALTGLVAYLSKSDNLDTPPTNSLEDVYPSRAVVVPITSGLPISLHPTQLQITVEHPTWIDLLPFPRMRDNLIHWEDRYDHAELAGDLIGDLIDSMSHFKLQTPAKPHRAKGPASSYDGEDELAATPQGIIIWGEPHSPASWEVTPGFLQKWRWTLGGCQDLIESSNRWRLSRGENPLVAIL